jgi:TonB-linked SusC/RagA family outer membrane protein
MGLAIAQNKEVSGTVTDASGVPLPGASVIVKTTNIRAVCDVNGKYSIQAPDESAILVFSYIGFIPQEITVGNRTQIDLTLEEDALLMEEVVVIAYGVAKKTSFTGSAAAITSKEIEKRPLTSVAASLEGNVSGIQVTSGLGQPGESASVRIRGFGSVNSSNSPLYLLDGVIYNGNISNLNPSDIESITVLKDAASTSLYGSSAGNGVILITTKKGTKSAEVNLKITQGWSSRAYKDYAAVNAYQYYPIQWEMLKQAYITAGIDPAVAASRASAEIVNTLKYNPFAGVSDAAVIGTDGTLSPSINGLKWGDDLNWEDAAYGIGNRQEYSLSYSTKTDKSDTYASIAYLNDRGYMLKTDFERYSLRLNHNINPVKWFKSGINANLSRTQSDYSNSDASNSSSYSNLARFVRTMAPIYPIHKHDLTTGQYLDANGNVTTNPSEYVYDYDGGRLSSVARDAIAETELNSRQISRMNSFGRVYITLLPVEGLNITSNYSLENNDLRRKVYENPHVGDGTAGPGRLNIRSTRSLSQTFNQLVNYTKSFDKHNVEALLGHENYSYLYEYFSAMKVNEIFENVYDFENFTEINSLTSYTDPYRKEGYLGRLNYDYAGRYYVSTSFRRDGSSRFHRNNRWGNFWSFGASWRISEENFLKDINWVNNLKLRASYGETGNDNILFSNGTSNYYPYQTLYDLGLNNGSEPGVYFSLLSNKDLKWETQISSDVALEFSLFKRLSGTVEYFVKTSSDLLFNVSLPRSAGVSFVTRNIGKSQNKGIEFELNYQFLKTNDWQASVGVNSTALSNKITLLPEENRKNGIISGSKKLLEGHSLYDFWLRQWYGVDANTGNGLFYLDTDAYNEEKGTLTSTIKNTLVTGPNGETLTNSYAYAKYDYSGSSIPKMYGGFNFKADYKGFELETVFSYALGGKILDSNNYGGLMSTAEYGNAMHPDLLKAWRKPGDITDVPRLDQTAAHNTSIGYGNSTRWLVSSDYLNLRSVVLSYTMPKKLLKPISLSNVRINLSAENLFMLKARQGLNPMANYTGLTYNEYMPARVITLGLDLSF